MLSVLITGAAADSRLAQHFALDRRKKWAKHKTICFLSYVKFK